MGERGFGGEVLLRAFVKQHPTHRHVPNTVLILILDWCFVRGSDRPPDVPDQDHTLGQSLLPDQDHTLGRHNLSYAAAKIAKLFDTVRCWHSYISLFIAEIIWVYIGITVNIQPHKYAVLYVLPIDETIFCIILACLHGSPVKLRKILHSNTACFIYCPAFGCDRIEDSFC